MERSVERNAEFLVDTFFEQLSGGTADFCALVGDELPVITVGEWLGLPSADFAVLRSLTHDQVHTQELFPTPSQLAISDSATRNLRKYFTDLIRERRKAPGDDPVSRWLRMWDEFEPDQDAADEAVYALALFMLLAALETTSHLLTTMMWLLLEHPRQVDWLRTHPEHIPGAIDETLRYDAPIHMISRIAPEDTELAGVPVREGEMVQLMVGAAHHDPEQYAAPEVFDVRRKAPHLSFGGGIHYCLGNALARMEATCVLTSLLRRLPVQGLRVAGTPTWAPRVAFRRLMELPVVRT
nr:cytochrome P450 [Streptomyces noursei]